MFNYLFEPVSKISHASNRYDLNLLNVGAFYSVATIRWTCYISLKYYELFYLKVYKTYFQIGPIEIVSIGTVILDLKPVFQGF